MLVCHCRASQVGGRLSTAPFLAYRSVSQQESKKIHPKNIPLQVCACVGALFMLSVAVAVQCALSPENTILLDPTGEEEQVITAETSALPLIAGLIKAADQ